MIDGWREATIRDACLKTRQWKPKTQPRGEFFYIDVSSVSNDTYSITTPQTVTSHTAPGRARRIVQSRDVIYATIRPTLKRIALVPPEYDDHIASTAFCVVRADRAKAIPEYLYFVLLSDAVSKAIADAQHGASYPAVTDKDILEQEITLPPLPEQKKIAAVLLKIQRAIETQDKIIQSLRDLKKSTMQHLFTHGLRGEKTKMTEFGPIPANWRIEILRDCATVQTGVAKGRKIAEHEALELPYLRVANVQDGHLDLTEMKTIRLRQSERSRFSLQDGDVVLTEGGDFDKLGRGFVWEGQIPDCVNQNHVFAVRADCKLLRPHFLAYLAQSSYGKAYFLKIAHKTTNLACINTTKLKRLPVPIPDRAEQDEIVASISTVDARTFHHESKKASLQDLFKTTLNKLMTGDIRVADLDIDVKEVEVCPERGVLNG
ncbi:MAG: restriction endonuclease subunit S [Lentisphaerales bacterium]|nr:MAG: restriction endonuclease subunit S [Lentisphaerales bacterium]